MTNYKEGEFLFQQKFLTHGYEVENLSTNPEYFHKDIDFKVVNPSTKAAKFCEVKWDSCIAKTNNLFVETRNCHSIGGKGWFRFCQADYIAYGDSRNRLFYFFTLEELKELIKTHSYNIRCCGEDSEGYIVPLKDIKTLKSYRCFEA